MKKPHTLTLFGGGSATNLRISGDVLLETLEALREGMRLAARFTIDGESTGKGPRPSWLDEVCAFDVTDIRPGSAMVDLEATVMRTLPEERVNSAAASPNQFSVDDSPVDLFANVVAAVMSEDPDSVYADRPLLDACARFAEAPGTEFEGIRLTRGAANSDLIITPADAQRIQKVRDGTASPKAVRVSGTLDAITLSKRSVGLLLSTNEKVTVHLDASTLTHAHQLLGKKVVIGGMATFRPSGKLLSVAAETLEAAGAADELWEKAPVGQVPKLTVKRVPQDENSGVAAIFGTWPGDETDEEMAEALKAVK